ncbi:MAG: hypothetical protein KKF12_17565 [Proteobacteria bacterium]|nr:hypothetical protein [Desulfobacula sp.]MBU3953148.1 hypothetical protein [Pseudomonadota bacterium]MBU4132628.1 hypothetical protein [Pseudomonadota bacterium]
MKKSKFEIGTTLAILPFVLGGTLFFGVKLSNTYISLDKFSAVAFFLTSIVFVLAALSYTLILTLIIQAITLIGNFKNGFWPSTETLMKEVCAWLFVYWMIVWGLPFSVAMLVFLYASKYYNVFIACSIGIFISLPLMFLIKKNFPDIWKASKEFNPERKVGWKKGLVLTLILFEAASFYINTCYTFEVKLSSTEFEITDEIEIHAKMLGKVPNQNLLRVKMVAIKSGGIETQPQAFDDESNGNFVTWIDLNKITPGKYRVIIFLKDYDKESVYKKLFFWKNYHDFKKSFIIRIEEHMEAA